MLFDRAAGYVERYMPEFMELFQKSALVEFPFRAHETEEIKKLTQEDFDLFCLPFPEGVVIEDTAGCVFLSDAERGQFGTIDVRRKFIDIIPLGNGEEFAYDRTSPSRELEERAIAEGVLQFSFGEIHSVRFSGRGEYEINAQVFGLILATKNGKKKVIDGNQLQDDPLLQQAIRGIIGNVVTAIEELALALRSGDRFFLESLPNKPRPAKTGRILRSHDRPRYVILRPQQILEKLSRGKALSVIHTGKQAHPRRQHWRHLRSEKFSQKRGQRVLIPAHWVGPSEVLSGQTRYRVRLDI